MIVFHIQNSISSLFPFLNHCKEEKTSFFVIISERKKMTSLLSTTSSTTTTRVINVKVANLRPSFNTLKEWVEANPTNHVYIGRPGVVFVDGVRYPPANHPSSKLFSNPFKIAASSSRDQVVENFRKYALERMKIDAEFRKGVFGLKGKVLGCWCAPLKCHGDILKEIAETLTEEDFVVEDERRRKREYEEDDKGFE